MTKSFYVYVITNKQRSHVLYIGVTGNLSRRVFQHKNKPTKGFTSRYNLTRLVYYEAFGSPTLAIDREKEIKGWRRLAERWTDVHKPGCREEAREIPLSAEIRRASG